MKKYTIALMMVFFAVASSFQAMAQMGKRTYSNLGWQYNAPIANDFVTHASGYGAYYQGGYYLTPSIAVGGFLSYNTNNQYIPTKTYWFEDGSALTTDLDHSLFQVPFGATFRYRFMRTMFQPYFEAKVGAVYSTQSLYFSTFMSEYSNWGFYVSPELGFTVYPFYKQDFGFHLAIYYSYSTNRNADFDLNGLNNIGFKLGIAF